MYENLVKKKKAEWISFLVRQKELKKITLEFMEIKS